jgi:CBS domain-containing protein/anti-sigma regulatory factor (Ser/Thr protein kinase)
MKGETSFSKIQELVYELKVSDIMKNPVITVRPRDLMSMFKAILHDKHISGTPVVDGDVLVGIISIEDLIKWLVDGDEDCTIDKKMSSPVVTVYGDEQLVFALDRLEKYGYGRLPVINRSSGKLVGIVTKGTIIEGLLRELETDNREEEIQKYRASHIFEDIVADEVELKVLYEIPGKDFHKGGEAASALRRTLKRLMIDPDICRRAAVAAYEAEMNVIFYTDGGKMEVNIKPDELHIAVRDRGPGIPDIEKALEPGYSTASDWIRELGFGAGMGLNNIQNCADDMIIDSVVNEGTKLDIIIHMGKNVTQTADRKITA